MSDVLGWDASGNGNDWTVNNLSITDQMLDSPTNNFATWNPLDKNTSYELSEGNLRAVTTNAELYAVAATFGMTSGKWYFEILDKIAGWASTLGVFESQGYVRSVHVSTVANGYAYYVNGDTYSESVAATYGDSWSANDIINVALDMDNGAIYFGKNGVWQNSATKTEIENGTTTNAAYTGLSGTYLIAVSDGSGSAGTDFILNAGQDDTFAGASSLPTRPSGSPFNDGNYGSFFYEPPTGFLALCTKNLPDVATGLWSGGDNQAFNTVTYTGDGNSSQTISGVNFQPDFTWIKNRSNAVSHALVDSVRQAPNQLGTDATSAENAGGNAYGTYGGISSLGDGEFTVTSGSSTSYKATNGGSQTYVAWNWKAGNATLGTGDFTQGTIPSTCSRNVNAGFSIVSYTGTGTAGATVGHGLSSAPELVIYKNRDITEDWAIYSKPAFDASSGDGVMYFATNAPSSTTSFFNNTAPTTTLLTVGTHGSTNGYASGSGQDHIAYCFHSVDGYSKVGSYTGNGSTTGDGTFVFLGFKPSYVMMKNTTGGSDDWQILDTIRDVDGNPTDTILRANLSSGEYQSGSNLADFLSNGFKLKGSGGNVNTSGSTYIFIAFAETPTKFSTAR